jgi:hypothetical protein
MFLLATNEMNHGCISVTSNAPQSRAILELDQTHFAGKFDENGNVTW